MSEPTARERAIEAAAKALWDTDPVLSRKSPWGANEGVMREGFRRARAMIAAYTQALGGLSGAEADLHNALEDLAAKKGRTMEQIIEDAERIDREWSERVVVCPRCGHAHEHPFPASTVLGGEGEPSEAQVELAARIMFSYQHAAGPHAWETIEDPGRDLWRHNARDLLRTALAERPTGRVNLSGCTPCTDCGRDYAAESDEPFLMSDDLWQSVVGTDGSVVLCPRCFVKRVDRAGVGGVTHVHRYGRSATVCLDCGYEP